MARKKKEIITEQPEVITPPPPEDRVHPDYRDENGDVRLPPIQYWKYRALSAEIAKTRLEYDKAKADFEAIVLNTPSLMNCRAQMASAKGQSAQFVAEINEFHKEVEEKTGLDLKNCAFDDISGRISVLP
jgi:hypothetical protein